MGGGELCQCIAVVVEHGHAAAAGQQRLHDAGAWGFSAEPSPNGMDVDRDETQGVFCSQ
jgi:hypothetical protein